MAYPTRGRDPFLDAATQAFLERRGVEALGLIILAVGVAFALAVNRQVPGAIASSPLGQALVETLIHCL